MADLNQMNKLLENSIDNLTAYTNIFNNASRSVTDNVEHMGKSANELRSQLNTLLADAQGLKELGKNININDAGQVDSFITKIKELDKTFSELAPSIAGNIKEMNKAFSLEFKLDDNTPGYLKAELNELNNVFKNTNLKKEVDNLAPDLGKFADNFATQVDRIEYDMGRLTEYGKRRNDTEKALGFLVERKDVAPIIEEKRAELSEYDNMAKMWGFNGYKDSKFKAELDEDAINDINRLEIYISQLENSIGKKLKGYVDLFNEANNLLKSGETNRDLFSIIGDPFSRSIYEEQGKLDWSKITPKNLREMNEGLVLPEDIVKDFGLDSTLGNTTKAVGDTTKAVENTTNAVENTSNAMDKAANSVINYREEISRLIETDKILSEAQKKTILDNDYSEGIKKYGDNVKYFSEMIKGLGSNTLTYQPGFQLNPNKAEDASELINYKTRIDAASEAMEYLQNQQSQLLSTVSDPGKINKAFSMGIDTDKLLEVKNILESGYRVNLIDGSTDKEKLDELRKQFDQFIGTFREFKIDVVPEEELKDILKLSALQTSISTEIKHQEAIQKASAEYEKNKVEYLAKQKELLQANANLEALRKNRDTLLATASTKKDNIKTERVWNDKENRYETKTTKYSDAEAIADRYSQEISRQLGTVNNAEKVIKRLENEFKKYNLEIPVTPTVKPSAKLTGEFRQDILGVKKAQKSEVLGGLDKYKPIIEEVNKKAVDLGINVDKANSRIQAIGNSIRSAFQSGNIDKAISILPIYGEEVEKLKNKVDGQAKAQDIAAKRQEDAIKSLMDETKNYVSTREALDNKPMSYEDQIEYYTRQAEAMKRLSGESREYADILKLKNQAEAKAAEASKRAAEEEKKAHQEALEAARSKVQGILNTVKSLADGINRAVNKIVQIIRTGISLVNRVISTADKIINTLASGVHSIITLFGSLSNRVRQIFGNTNKSVNGLTGSMNLLKGSATELRSKIMLLKGAFDTVFNNQIINKGKNLLTAIATMNVVMGDELTNNTIKWAQELERALGISATDLIADLKEISAVLYGLGMSSEDTALGAQNLGMMSRYLGMMGLAGGNVDQVMTKLASGMKGMTQAIDDLGLSVRDSQMQNFIKNLKNGTSELGKALREQGVDLTNMGDDFSALNEKARVYIRYSALIEQFKSNYDLSDFARQLNTVTGRLSILSQTWSSLATGIGIEFAKVGAIIAGYLIPIIKRLQVYLLGTVKIVNGVEVQIEGLVHKIQTLINKIGNFFGIDIGIKLGESLNAGLNKLNNTDTSGIEDTNKKLEETGEKLDKISEKSKKAGGNLQSFDRISNSTKSSSDSGNKDNDFDYSVLMNSALDSLQDYTDTADNYFEILDKNLTETVKKIKEKLKEVAEALTGRKLNFGFDNEATKNNLNKTWQEIKKLVTSWGGFVIKIGLKIADDVNIGAILTKLSELLAKITEVANIISDVLQPALDILYETGIKPIMEYLGVETLNIIDWLIEKLDKLAKWFTENKDTIYKFFEDLGNKIAQLFRIITGNQTLDDVIAINTDESGWGTFLRIIDSIPERISKAIGIIKELVSVITGAPSLDAVITMNSGTDWGNILSIISSLRDILGQLLDKLGDFVNNEGLTWLQERLNELANWIKTNKDKIIELVDKLAGIAWEAFKVFVDLVGKLIDYVVNNPDSVLTFFKSLLGLKVASWFTSVASSIGLALIGMKGFTGLLGKISGGAAAAGEAAAGGGAAAAGGAAASGAAAGGVALGPILAVIAAVVALIASIKDLWDTSEKFRDNIKAIWDNIVEAFNNAKEKIGEAFSNIKEAWDNFYKAYDNSFFKDLIESLVTLIANYLGGAIASLIDLVGNLFATIGNLLADLINIVAGVFDVLGGLWNLISGIFTLDGDKIKEGWGQVCTGLVEIVTGLFQGIVDIAGGIVGAIIDAGSAIVGGLGQGISDAWNGFIEWVRGLFDSWITSVKEFFGIHSPSTLFAEIGSFLVSGLFEGIKNAWEGFKNGVIELCNSLVDTIKGIFSGIGSFFSDTFQKAKEMATNAWSDAKDKFNDIKNNVTGAFNDVKDKVGGTFNQAKEMATNAWSDAKAVFTGVADKVADGFNTVKDKVKGTFNDLKNSITNTFNDIKGKASGIWDKFKTGVNDFGTTVYTKVTGKTKATKGYPITTNANGGSIAGGELFIANEHGEPELMGKIDKTGRTNVANNRMIIDAMRSGVFEAVYNAMAEVHNQTAGRGTGGVSKLEINGFGLIDPSTIRELARLLAPYFNSNNINIADTEFSIN